MVLQTIALLFHAIKQLARPDKLGGKHAQGERDNQPSRPGRDEHHDSECEQRESEEYLQKPLCLLK